MVEEEVPRTWPVTSTAPARRTAKISKGLNVSICVLGGWAPMRCVAYARSGPLATQGPDHGASLPSMARFGSSSTRRLAHARNCVHELARGDHQQND